MRQFVPALSLLFGCAVAANAGAACPNDSATFTIPADVVIYDQLCVPLDCSSGACKVYNGQGSGLNPVLNATSVPAVTGDASGLHFTANGAARGLVVPAFVLHVPSNKGVQLTGTVGPAVESISAGTTTP